MMYVKREENESLGAFINRACDIKNRQNEDVTLDFGDGIVLNTENYQDSNDIISDIRYDYIIESSKNYNDIINDEIDLDEEEIMENLPDDSKEDEIDIENVESKDIESDNLEEDIEENLPIEDSSNFDSMETIESDSKLENNNEETFGIKENINYNSLESLDLLTKYALVSGEYEKLNEEEVRSIDEKLEETKAQYKDLLEVKKEEYNQKITQINLAAKFQTEQMLSTNKSIDNSIAYYQSLKDEYNDIMQKQEKEKSNFEDGMKEFRKKIENSSAVKDTIELINKYDLKNNENYAVMDALKLISMSDQSIKEELNKIQKLKWNVEAYDEYVSEFYSDNYIEQIDAKIEELQSGKITKEDVKHNMEEFMLQLLPGSVVNENGNMSYNLVKNDEELKVLREQIEQLENKKTHVDNHPVSLECEIIDMMRSGAERQLISEKVNRLTSMIHQDNINESFDSDKEELENIEKELEEKRNFIKTKQADLDAKKYINQDLIDLDELKLTRLIEQREKELENIKRYDAIIENKETYQKVKELDKRIEHYRNLKNEAVSDLYLYISLHGEKPGDKQLERLREIVDFNNNIIEDFKKNKADINKDIKLSERFTPIAYAEAKRKLSIQIEKGLARDIDKLTKDIQNKKDNELYVDLDVKNRMLNDIENANDDIELLESLKIALTNYSINNLSKKVVNYKNNNLDSNKEEEKGKEENFDEELEEISKFSTAKKALIEKIKSLSFKKIAIAAVTTITAAAIAISAAVAHHSNKKELEELKQNALELEQELGNFNESFTNKVEEINENLEKEQEDSKIETHTITKDEEENIVDTSKIASTAEDAAKGNFIDEDKIHTEYFSNEMVQSLNDFDTIDGKDIQTIVGHDGTIIGFTEAELEENETVKTR